MNSANHFAIVFLGTPVVSVTDALVDILVHPQIFDALIVVAMEILIVASLDRVILKLVVASSVLTILRAVSVRYAS